MTHFTRPSNRFPKLTWCKFSALPGLELTVRPVDGDDLRRRNDEPARVEYLRSRAEMYRTGAQALHDSTPLALGHVASRLAIKPGRAFGAWLYDDRRHVGASVHPDWFDKFVAAYEAATR